MSAINFVVRDSVGNLQRGVTGESGSSNIVASVGEEISLNLSRAQVESFQRQGQALVVTLVTGQVITIEGYFTPEGVAENRLFLSSGGVLTEVSLVDAGEGFYYANYAEAEAFGKWSPNDDLYFLEGNEVSLAGMPADDDTGMLAAPLLAGLGGSGLGALLGLGGAAVGLGLIDEGGNGGDSDTPTDGDEEEPTDEDPTDEDPTDEDPTDEDPTDEDPIDEDPTDEDPDDEDPTDGDPEDPDVEQPGGPEVEVTSGVSSGGHVINYEDYSDGVEVGGTGTPGGTVTVVVDGHTETTTVDANGNWEVVYEPGVLETGEYETPVTVTIELDGETSTATDTLVFDTDAHVTLDDNAGGADGIINAVELAGGVVLTGTVEAGSTVVVTIGGEDFTAIVTDTTWSLELPEGTLEAGEYQSGVTVTATDAYNNSTSVAGTVVVDTVSTVSINTAGIEGDGIVNAAERADGITLTGTAQAGSSVVVTLNGHSQTVTATANGQWSTAWTADQLPTGEVVSTVTAIATDAAGNTATASGDVTFDTVVDPLQHTNGAVGGDGVINFAERGQSITVSGVVEAGSSVTVTLAGVAVVATVTADGNWTATYPAGAIAGGEYATQLIVSARDAAGNVSTLRENVTVDTVVGDVALSSQPIEIDDVVNGVERADGVVIRGTATAGLTVTVTLGGVSHQVVADSDGNWASTFAPSEVPTGTYDAAITASITDAAGNSKSVTDTVHIDTQVDNFAFSTAPVESNDIISFAERADGVVLSGTVEAGSTVVVTFGTGTQTVVAGANGQWSATFAAGQIAGGEYNATMTAVATDVAGNTATITDTVRVDTIVNRLTLTSIEGDNVINAAEASDGVTLTGRVEEGSSVVVTMGGVSHIATVTNGVWSANFLASEIPGGEYTAQVTALATDAQGNTRTLTSTVDIDTVAPEAPMVLAEDSGRTGLRSIAIADEDTSLQVYAIDANGTASELTFTMTEDTQYDEIDLRFTNPVSNGTQLVLTSTDDAGNSSSTLMIFDHDGTHVVDADNAGLESFDIASIDLAFADNAELELTASDIADLTNGGNQLTILGGSDDTLNITGATDAGTAATVIEGESYTEYLLGDTSILVNDNINVVI